MKTKRHHHMRPIQSPEDLYVLHIHSPEQLNIMSALRIAEVATALVTRNLNTSLWTELPKDLPTKPPSAPANETVKLS